MSRSAPARVSAYALLWLALFGGGRPDTPQFSQIVVSDLKDFQATVKVEKADRTELNKINRDFGMAYSLRDLTMRYKEPNKLRMEGSVGWLVFNGSTRCFRVPQLKLTKRDDLGESPGKRYTLFDIGILTPSALAVMQTKYLRSENLDGVAAQVFDMKYRGDDTSRFTIWVDLERRVVLKRAWYDATEKLKAVFLYQEHRQLQPGLWAPTRLEVRNGDDAVAGVTSYSDLKINQGLDDSLFTIS
jgi:outer membrane lipoprotein-sorting protein